MKLEEIRRLIAEASTDTIDGYACSVTESSMIKTAFVYDAEVIHEVFKMHYETQRNIDYFKFFELLVRNGIAMIRIKKSKGNVMPCNGAWQVVNSAGDGKLAYGLGYIISPTKKIFSDRLYVSPAARGGWRKQKSKRKSKPFDDWRNPRTPDPSDDCEVYGPDDPDADALDRSYDISSIEESIQFDKMRKNNAKLIDAAKKLTGLTKIEIEDAFNDAPMGFFDSHFEGELNVERNHTMVPFMF